MNFHGLAELENDEGDAVIWRYCPSEGVEEPEASPGRNEGENAVNVVELLIDPWVKGSCNEEYVVARIEPVPNCRGNEWDQRGQKDVLRLLAANYANEDVVFYPELKRDVPVYIQIFDEVRRLELENSNVLKFVEFWLPYR